MKKYWFKRKRYGWGWTPCTWQGWAITLVSILLIIANFIQVDSRSHSGSDTLIGSFIFTVLIIIILIVICYRTGEKPKWQWGAKSNNN